MSQEQVHELREKLRNDRNGNQQGNGQSSDRLTSTSGGDIEASFSSGGNTKLDYSNIPTTAGYGIQSLSGSSNRNAGSDGQPIITESKLRGRTRSTSSVNIGRGQSDGRSSENNGTARSDRADIQTSTHSSKSIGIGNLFTDEIPARTFNTETTPPPPKVETSGTKPEGKGSTAIKAGSKRITSSTEEKPSLSERVAKSIEQKRLKDDASKPFYQRGKTLTVQEAKDYLEPLCQALEDSFGYVDQFLWDRQKDVTEQPIWSDTTDEEIKVIASLMIKRAQRSPAAATIVRNTIEGADYFTAAVVIIPRAAKTIGIMRTTSKRNKKNAN